MAERTLLDVYPVVASLLGKESFQLLARDFWRTQPPSRGDLSQWGGALADFLEHNAQLVDEPYLGDVARVEWALHQAGGAADRNAQTETFGLLTSTDPDRLTVLLASGTWTYGSAYPAASVVRAHLYETPSLAEAGQRLREGVREGVVVWRRGFKPQVDKCSAAEAIFLNALLGGCSLLKALESTPSDFDFQQWLPAAVQSGLLLGVTLTQEDALSQHAEVTTQRNDKTESPT